MGDLKERVIALLKDPSDFKTYDEQAAAIISLARADALEEAAKACEALIDAMEEEDTESWNTFHEQGPMSEGATRCISAIRNLKDKP